MIRKIEAKKPVKRKNVAAYARVSMETVRQRDAAFVSHPILSLLAVILDFFLGRRYTLFIKLYKN